MTYARTYWDKSIIKLHHIDKLSPKAKARYKAITLLSKLYYVRAYHRATSFNARDFLRRLIYLHKDNIRYLQVGNGSEWEKHFIAETKKRKITLVHNYPHSPKMNTFVERVNGTIQAEYLDRFYEETK